MAIDTCDPTATALPHVRTVTTLPADLRQLRRDALEWALAHGRRVNADALTLVIAARLAAGGPDGALRWTAEDVESMVWIDALSWCDQHGAAPPPCLADSLATWIEFLLARELAAGGATQAQLRAAIRPLSGQGSRARHPTARIAAQVLPFGPPAPMGA